MVAIQRLGPVLLAAGGAARAVRPMIQDLFIQNHELQTLGEKFVKSNYFLGQERTKLIDSKGDDSGWRMTIECREIFASTCDALPGAREAPKSHCPKYRTRACKVHSPCAARDLVDAKSYRDCSIVMDDLGYCHTQCSHTTPCSNETPFDQALPLLEGGSLATLHFTGPTNMTNQNQECSVPRGTQWADAVTESLLSNFKFYAQHAAATYCNTKDGINHRIECGGSCPLIEAAGTDIQLYYVFSGTVFDVNGYVSVDHQRKEIVIAFRGSWSARNWIWNFVAAWSDCPYARECKVHTGFYTTWRVVSDGVTSVVQQLMKKFDAYKVVTTGHSLGGALATIAAVELRYFNKISVDAYTYGAPRIGNSIFANFASAQTGTIYRITHGGDFVPRLPPTGTHYAHTSPEYWIDNSKGPIANPGVADIVKCTGTFNNNCNAGAKLEHFVHYNYFGPIDGCKRIVPYAK
ncbi:hypothetical protein DCS_06191 [Drechmeria coniospora]|uniref:Fungal lipase-type domain-containing protein n=1 Tax=Drechmeria coniospora TaxID=98403 RepID=A0A151GB08_DRECN|nr:hypothetical protein DCS_06191 [Drechmeria coniospora]KYK54234.1 hypothetical protein DCS_06191 [Drechmeria coniospora]